MPLDTLLACLSVIGVSALSASLGALAVIAWRPKRTTGHRLTIHLPEGCNPTGSFTIEGIVPEELAFESITIPATPEAMGAIPPEED